MGWSRGRDFLGKYLHVIVTNLKYSVDILDVTIGCNSSGLFQRLGPQLSFKKRKEKKKIVLLLAHYYSVSMIIVQLPMHYN